MVRIRLRRVGARHQPSYRIVVADRESPRDGRFLEIIGNYNPRTEPSTVIVDEARLFHWMEHGAQPSDSVKKVLGSMGTWDRWGRLKSGESLEVLLEEAKGAHSAVDPRTDRPDKVGARPSKKSRAKAEAEQVEAPPPAAAEASTRVKAPAGVVAEVEMDEPAAVEPGPAEDALGSPASESLSDMAGEGSSDDAAEA